MRAGAKAAATVTLSAGAFGCYKYQTDEGARRALIVYSSFGPVVAHYRAVEARLSLFPLSPAETSAEYRRLDEKYAERTVKVIGELQGMYTKYAQTCAGFTNTLSNQWIQELRKLEDRVPPRSAETVLQTILEETGKPASETFATFDPEPLGSASIGQVHRATLKVDGREVAVKVQYPDSEQLFRKDMGTIRSFFTLAAPENLYMLDQLEQQNALELDYTIEASNLTTVGANMRRHGFAPREVVVPQPIAGLATRRLLVMELLPGPKLIDGLRAYGRIVATERGTSLETMEEEMRARFESGDIPTKYAGPSARAIALYRAYGWLKDALLGTKTTLPPNGPRLVDTLMRVHGHQLLADGLFNADPHGGNFLMLPDDRIGLIDYGATKRFSTNERLATCVLFVALMKGDEQMCLDMCEVSGYKSKYNKKEVVYKLMKFAYDTYSKDLTGGKNLIEFVDELKAEDPWHEVPDNFVMAQMMSIRLRSLALGMNIPITVSDWWGPIAAQVLEREGLPYEMWDRRMLEQYRPEFNIVVNRF
jgi:aarF domain-containing kinase